MFEKLAELARCHKVPEQNITKLFNVLELPTLAHRAGINGPHDNEGVCPACGQGFNGFREAIEHLKTSNHVIDNSFRYHQKPLFEEMAANSEAQGVETIRLRDARSKRKRQERSILLQLGMEVMANGHTESLVQEVWEKFNAENGTEAVSKKDLTDEEIEEMKATAKADRERRPDEPSVAPAVDGIK